MCAPFLFQEEGRASARHRAIFAVVQSAFGGAAGNGSTRALCGDTPLTLSAAAASPAAGVRRMVGSSAACSAPGLLQGAIALTAPQHQLQRRFAGLGTPSQAKDAALLKIHLPMGRVMIPTRGFFLGPNTEAARGEHVRLEYGEVVMSNCRARRLLLCLLGACLAPGVQPYLASMARLCPSHFAHANGCSCAP